MLLFSILYSSISLREYFFNIILRYFASLLRFILHYTIPVIVSQHILKEFSVLIEEQRAEKLEITVDYTDGLIEKGGISTDVFKSALGKSLLV